jgi:hypothetical protein
MSYIQSPKIIMTSIKFIPLTFSFEIGQWGQLHFVFYMYWDVVDFLVGKLTVGHQMKVRNPFAICLVMDVPKHSPPSKIWVPSDYFLNKKTAKSPQVSTEGVKVHFEQSCGLCKENF